MKSKNIFTNNMNITWPVFLKIFSYLTIYIIP